MIDYNTKKEIPQYSQPNKCEYCGINVNSNHNHKTWCPNYNNVIIGSDLYLFIFILIYLIIKIKKHAVKK